MESIINLAGKELPVHVSIKTIIDYKSTFGTDIFEDLEKIQTVNANSLGSLSSIVNTSFQILYILHKPYAKNKSFSDFLDEFEFTVFQDNTSLNELTGVFSLLFPSQKEEGKSK